MTFAGKPLKKTAGKNAVILSRPTQGVTVIKQSKIFGTFSPAGGSGDRQICCQDLSACLCRCSPAK